MAIAPFTKEQLSSRSYLHKIIQKYIESAHVEDYEYDSQGECCDDCYDEDDDCDGCSCHEEFPGFDQNLTNIIAAFILNNYIPKEQ